MTTLEGFTMKTSLQTTANLMEINHTRTTEQTSLGTMVSPLSVTTNVASNSTEHGETAELTRLASYFVPMFFTIIITVGFVGNSLVITVMTKIFQLHGQRLNNTNRFILNLAVSDLLFLIFCVPFHATVYTLNGWPFGRFICFFTKFCEEMMKIASVYTLVALSVDRFFAVVYATSARQVRTRKNAIRGLIFIWTAATGMAVPVVFTRVYLPDFYGQPLCVPGSKLWTKWYELCLTLFGYILPLLVIICCYVGLLHAMCKSAQSSSITISNRSSNSRKKVTRIVVLVVIVFAVCWMPHHVVSLWIQFAANFNFKSKGTLVLRLVAHCMAYANSCINPLVYAFVSKKFRQDFKRAFTCQYLAEAVGSVKEFSRRVMGSTRQPWNGEVVRSRRHFQDVLPGTRSPRVRGETSGVSEEKTRFCPRSPLSQRSAVLENDNLLVRNEQDSKQRASLGTQISTLTIQNCEEDLLIQEDGCAFDDESPQRTAVV